MPLDVKITLDQTALRAAFAQLGKGARRSANQAVNRALTGARTDAVRHLAREAGLKSQRVVRGASSIRKSRPEELRGKLIIRQRHIPLSNVKGVKVRRAGVFWRGRKIDRAFRLEKLGALSNDIFIRQRKGRSFRRAYAYPLLQEYEHRETPRHLRKTVPPRLQKAFQHNLERAIQRAGFRNR